jgi:hypothetical protein
MVPEQRVIKGQMFDGIFPSIHFTIKDADANIICIEFNFISGITMASKLCGFISCSEDAVEIVARSVADLAFIGMDGHRIRAKMEQNHQIAIIFNALLIEKQKIMGWKVCC